MLEIFKIVHVVPAALATLLGFYIVFSRKGTAQHKLLGRVWLSLIVFICLTSFLISTPKLEIFPGFTWIHILSLLILITSGFAFVSIKNGKRELHAIFMSISFAILIIAGAFTLLVKQKLLEML